MYCQYAINICRNIKVSSLQIIGHIMKKTPMHGFVVFEVYLYALNFIIYRFYKFIITCISSHFLYFLFMLILCFQFYIAL